MNPPHAINRSRIVQIAVVTPIAMQGVTRARTRRRRQRFSCIASYCFWAAIFFAICS